MKTIRLRAVPESLHDNLVLILKDNEKTAPSLMRPMLNEIIEENLDFLERDISHGKKHIQISGVPDEVFHKIYKIATNKGLTIEQLIRLKLDLFVDNYPIKL